MTRILVNLTAFNLAALLAAFFAGWASFFLKSRETHGDPTFPLHIFLGLLAATTTLGLHSLVFIYFLGTGRWVKEVSIAYEIADVPYHKATRELKRRAFPAALAAMLAPIAAAAAGAGVQTMQWPWPWHAGLAVFAIAVNSWAFFREYACVSENAVVIDGVMHEVDRIRAERGLPTNEEALREQESIPE